MASGGSGGGGKIRTRRHHLGAAKPPYARGKQQLGLISRVTESVKNIVPGWLQKYFNKREDKCVDTNESANEEENPVNYHHDYANEDALVIDGRITPESARINLEEPSTSRSALNFSDVLTRPSLHRSHLNCTVLDSTVPHCQPSTSSSLGIGSPGLSLVKEIKDSTSQHDDDNISTTSGFSSRASDKDITVSKNTSAPLLWSPEAERSHSVSQHPASSSKKPAFNLSAFGSPSPSLGNTSVFKTRQLGDSPFYPGKTSYGGAAAAARQTKVQISAYQPPIKRQMKAKQANVQSYGVTSSTARRILQTLEKMSSPLADAKRIPSSVSSPLSSPVDRSVLNVTSFQSRQNQMDSQHPPVQKLVTPKPISLTGSQITYFKPSLKSATSSRKIHQRADTDHQDMIEESFPAEQPVKSSESNLSYPKPDIPASNGLSSGGRMDSACGKMRRERERYCASRPGQKQQLEMEQELPEVPLPISSASLPTFNFSFPATSAVSSSPSTVSKAVVNKVQPASNVGSPTFVFSSPIVKSTEVEVLPPLSIKFTFSVPVVKSSELSGSTDTPVTSILSPGSATVNSTSNKKEEEEEYDGFCKPAKFLKQGSVLDILKSPGFMSGKLPSCSSAQPVTSTVVYTRPAISSFSAGKDTSKQASSFWQSDTHDPCLQNKTTDGKCVTCEAAKVSTVESTKQTISVSPCVSSKTTVPTAATLGFEDKFKPAPNTWDCDTCLVQNKPEATKCVACETPKPGTGVMPALTMPVVTDNAVTVTSTSSSTATTVTLGFGDKFKQPKGSWNCSVCLEQNAAEYSKCVACESEKPGSSVPVTSSSVSAFSASSGGFLDLDKFKKPEGSWECEVCLVQNEAEATKCVACENVKPGTKAELKGFGTAAVSTNAAMPSFTFGLPSSSSESSQTLGSTGSFKFGEQSSFKFGIASESASSNTVTGGFKFPTGSGNFKFGVSSSDSKSEDSKKESKSNIFTFGLPSTSSQAPSTFQFGTTSLGQQEKKEAPPVLGGFGFAATSTSSIATNENKTGVSGFTFGTMAEKDVASPALPFKKSDEKKDETVSTKGSFSFGSVESAPASQFVLGRAEEKQDSVTSAGPLAFGKKADNEELKAQPIFSSGTAEHTKEESTAKPVFNFSFGKPSEKESEQAKAPFAFGAQTSTCDQGASFSFLNSSSSSTAAPTTSANSSSMFGSTLSSSNPQPVPAPFVFGQPSNTVTSSVFGNPAESATSQSFGFSQDNKPATTSSSTGSTLTPFLFGSGESSTNAANSGFTFGATTTSSSTGSSSSFLFGSGPPAPAAGPAFGAGQPPAFGPSPGSSQPSAPSFGSLSTTLFSAGSHPAPSAFGSVTSSTQPSVFGQQATQQPAFGSGTPSAGSVFHFGSTTTNFNFPNNPGVFTFGANPPAPAAPAPPSGTSGFSFNQPAAFTVGTNGKNVFSASGSSVPGRRIKTAVRRRK
ncbi:nuclear pore complex protein Nup153-like isoform X3 [Corvus kubaryi]|uniref:nuclear pore complex protein Nup153-like isoform X3 n=1 Tax=Corvus kubaryi TaxID=68294 RepID=UPI001C03A5CF|nr:nuclear pore complex protein Nup153-like isoform X3 [Corvus kubaryi]XP_041902735.1 nuclear pore complex protein Nup153-like isoform X3 [Corvus kubaryi]